MRERQELLDRARNLSVGIDVAPFETLLGFDSEERRRWWRALVGFSLPEAWGTWTDGTHASFCVQVDPAPVSDIEVSVDLQPFVPASELTASVVVNGAPLAEWQFRPEQYGTSQSVGFSIPAEVIAKNGLLWIAFVIRGAISPREAGVNQDDRRLGLGFQRLMLRRRSS